MAGRWTEYCACLFSPAVQARQQVVKSRERAGWLRGRAAGGAHLAGSKAGTLKVRASPAVEGPAQLIWAKDAMLTYDRMSLVLTGLIRIVLSNKSATEMNEGSKILNSQLVATAQSYM